MDISRACRRVQINGKGLRGAFGLFRLSAVVALIIQHPRYELAQVITIKGAQLSDTASDGLWVGFLGSRLDPEGAAWPALGLQ